MPDLSDVSEHAKRDLETYAELTVKWSKRINLISQSTHGSVWDRHIVDSAQVFHVKQEWAGHHVDLGSGGGYPGLVISILAKHSGHDLNSTLIESDRRKVAFLQTVIRELRLPAKAVCSRIEAMGAQKANILTARALADLKKLLGYGSKHLRTDGVALFPKGASWQSEVDAARSDWRFSVVAHESVTNPASRILEIGAIERAK